MDRTEFEPSLRQEGYEVRKGEIERHQRHEAHAYDFDARILVLDGLVTLVYGTDRVTYRGSDSCNVPAGTTNEKHIETDGAQCIANRRTPQAASAPDKWQYSGKAASRSRLHLLPSASYS